MVAERRLATPENYAYLALLFSLLRPELQGYLKQEAVNPAISAISNPYNLTGLAFSGVAPYGTNYYGNDMNNFIPSKEAIATSGNYDPLSQYLNWQPNTHFNNSGTALILADTQVRSHLDSESGYSSDEVRSPLSTTSYSSQSSRQTHSPFDDLSDLGAAGYTPDDHGYVHSLEDYVDLETLANNEPNKATRGIDLPLGLKQEPDYLLERLLGPEPTSYTTDLKTSPGGNYFPDDFQLDLETKDFDPFSIDFAQTLTNNSFEYPMGNDLESLIDFDALDSLDFNLPSDILTTDQGDSLPNNIDMQLQNLIQTPALARNGSGHPSDLTTVTPLDNSKKLTNILPTHRGPSPSKKKVSSGKKKVPAAKKMAAVKAVKSEPTSIVDISDDAIVDMSVNDFNVYVETLTEEQAKYVRDVRRRGKNKQAARVCRKRKLEVIDDLEGELEELKLEKKRVIDERRAILEETATLKAKIKELESSVFSSFRDDNGRPLSQNEYSLFQGENGTMYIGKTIENNSNKEEKST